MKHDDPKTDVTTEFDMPGEISGVGEVIKGWVNIHVTVGVEGGTAYSGHLASARIETHFVRVFVEPFAAPQNPATPKAD
jgi:predicted DNA-binding protein with PD1-like motif